jgi:predicted nucleic acid-binding protein
MLVLDANILIRAVLGRRARSLLASYGASVEFFTPDVALAEAREHLPQILSKRGIPVPAGLEVLATVSEVVQVVDVEAYSACEEMARQRLQGRDPEDWPVLATALLMGCPIWTEDTDFFGAGVATWTTDRVELFLQSIGNR